MAHHVDVVFEVNSRKYTTLLAKEQEKREIQEGLIKACDVIDLIIEILRGSKSRDQVKKCLTDGITAVSYTHLDVYKRQEESLRTGRTGGGY